MMTKEPTAAGLFMISCPAKTDYQRFPQEELTPRDEPCLGLTSRSTGRRMRGAIRSQSACGWGERDERRREVATFPAVLPKAPAGSAFVQSPSVTLPGASQTVNPQASDSRPRSLELSCAFRDNLLPLSRKQMGL